MLLALLLQAAAHDGLWTNEEQVAFVREARQPAPEWVGVRIDAGRIERINRQGQTTASPMSRVPSQADGDTLLLPSPAGPLVLRRAHPFTCWVSVPRPDGEWLFRPDVALFDGGGRATVGGGDTGAEAVTIHLRNVVSPPPSTNRPSLVLYAYRADDAERAAGYAWAEPDAARLGLNLRWTQASCTKDTPP